MLRGAPEAANSATALRECHGIRVTGGPHLREAGVHVRPRHALPDAAERLVRALVLQRGSRGLHRQPIPVSVGGFGSLVPGGQHRAGVRADARCGNQLPPGRQRVFAEPLYHADGHAAQQRRHPLSGGENLPCRFSGLAFGQPSPRHMVPLLLIAEPGHFGDHLAGRQARVRQPGQASRQMPGRPAAQRADHRLARVAGYGAELGQQRHQPGKRHSGFEVVIPVGRVQRLPGRLVISIAQVMHASHAPAPTGRQGGARRPRRAP